MRTPPAALHGAFLNPNPDILCAQTPNPDRFMEAVGASERVMKLLDSKPAAQIAAGKKLPYFSGNVALKDVVFK